MRRLALAAIVLAAIGGLVLVALGGLVAPSAGSAPAASSPSPDVEVVGYDMDPSGNSCPNDGTNCTLGSIERCVEVGAGDSFEYDLYLEGLREGESVSGWGINFGFPDEVMWIETQTQTDPLVNLCAQPGSAPYDWSGEGVPDYGSPHGGKCGDFGAGEHNPPYTHGVLGRYGARVYPDTSPGAYLLEFSQVIIARDVPPGGNLVVGRLDTGVLALDVPCGADEDAVPDGDDNCPHTYNPEQADADGDGLGDACDYDDDDDGYSDADEEACGSDPLDPLSVPSDNDGDLLADCVDPDDDGDGYWDDKETLLESDPLDAGSTPEACDGVDNDGDLSVDEGYDRDPVNGVADCDDPAADTDGDETHNPDDGDDDNDGYDDVTEGWVGTDSLVGCPEDELDEAWPPDMDNSGVVDIIDVLTYKARRPDFYDRRWDLDMSGAVKILDVLQYKPVLGESCVSP